VEHTKAENVQKTEMPVNERRSILEALQAVDPNIFTKVPELREVVRREQQFSERFASVEDAEASALKAERYEKMSRHLFDASTTERQEFDRVRRSARRWLPSSLTRTVEGTVPSRDTPGFPDLV
jgi:hypothetical protein